jgi:hypothetical protein
MCLNATRACRVGSDGEPKYFGSAVVPRFTKQRRKPYFSLKRTVKNIVLLRIGGPITKLRGRDQVYGEKGNCWFRGFFREKYSIR